MGSKAALATSKAKTHTLTLPAEMLVRGFWLYVWRVRVSRKELLYVGRTGDNSSPFATPPYQRMGQHLGRITSQNSLRQHLEKRGHRPEDCVRFELISHGPLFPEVSREIADDRAALMNKHKPIRNIVGALEKKLADSLRDAGYTVLNEVSWNPPLDEKRWGGVRLAFAKYFPELRKL